MKNSTPLSLTKFLFFFSFLFTISNMGWTQVGSFTSTPSSVTVEPNGTFSVVVAVQVSDAAVDGAEAHLNFDPAILQVVDVTILTTELAIPIEGNFDNTLGQIDYTRGTFGNFPTTDFDFIEIDFEAIGTGNTSITYNTVFPRQTKVTSNFVDILGTANAIPVEIAAANENPIASFTASPTSGTAALFVSVNASTSFDPDGDVSNLDYTWNFGDGNTGIGVMADNNYTVPNTYTITLTVTDNDGGVGTATQNIIVSGITIPTYTITATAGPGGTIDPLSATIDEGGSQTFTITPDTDFEVADVTVDGNSVGAVTSYEFTNVQADTQIGASFTPIKVDSAPEITLNTTATVDEGGNISVPLLITDADGDNLTVTITSVSNEPQELQSSNNNAQTNPYPFDASGFLTENLISNIGGLYSSDLVFTPNFGDGGSNGDGNGVYTITIVVTDEDDNTIVENLDLTVNDVHQSITDTGITTLEAESYDNQGPANAGSGNNGIGVEVNPSLTNIGFTTNGDFAEYLIDVETEGTYSFDFFVAKASGPVGTMTINGGPASISVSSTDNWQNYVVANATVVLSAGQQKLRFDWSGPTGFFFNMDYFEVTKVPDAPFQLCIASGSSGLNAFGRTFVGDPEATSPTGLGFSRTNGNPYADYSGPINGAASGDETLLFQKEIYGGAGGNNPSYTYDIPVVDGFYQVDLYFAEVFHSTTSKRVFDVLLEGNVILDEYEMVDPIKDGIPTFQTAITRTYYVNVTDGSLQVGIGPAEIDNGKLAGLCITAVSSANLHPMTAIGNLTYEASATIADPLNITDPENDQLNVVFNGMPASLTYNPSTNQLEGNPLLTEVGSYTINAIISDGTSAPVTEEFILVIYSPAGNDAPIINPIGDVDENEGNTVTATTTVTDEDTPTVSIVIYDKSVGGGANTVPLTSGLIVPPADYSFTDDGNGNYTLTWVTDNTDGRSYSATITADDGVNPPVSETFTIDLAQNISDGPIKATTFNNPVPRYGNQQNNDGYTVSVETGNNNIGYIEPGEFVEYLIDVPTAGSYELRVNASKGSNLGGNPSFLTISEDSGGFSPIGTLSIPNTGWNPFVTYTTTVTFSNVGVQRLRFDFGGSMNIQEFEFIPTTNNTPPVVTIETPIDGLTVEQGSTIDFTATADDTQDGNVAASVVWNSDIDGNFGTGANVNTSDLSNGTHIITATAADNDPTTPLPGSSSIAVTIYQTAPACDVRFRVNAGGGFLTNSTGDFEEDQTGTPSQYINLTAPALDQTFGSTTPLAFNTTGYPDVLFQTERYSEASNPNNMQWTFPTGNGIFEVKILFNENWANENANTNNNRIFDVLVEGDVILDDYRPSGPTGADFNVAKVETYLATVTDGSLNIDFEKINQNPAVKGFDICFVAPISDTVPVVAIIEPLDGATINRNVPTTFTGSATDVEDDDTALTSNLTWSSTSEPNFAGTGDTFSDILLVPGTHVLEASVTDSDDNTVTEGITVTVPGPIVVFTSPTDDAILESTDVQFTWSAENALLFNPFDEHFHFYVNPADPDNLNADERISTASEIGTLVWNLNSDDGIVEGENTVVVVAAESLHTEFTNPEARDVVTFTVCTTLITSITSTDPTDCAGADGELIIVAAGTNLEYSIDDGLTFQGSGNFSGLPAGIYDIVVRQIGTTTCTATDTVVLTTPVAPSITEVVSTDPTDCGIEDGQIAISATGTNLEYSIDNGITFESGNIFTDLSAGLYGIIVRENGTTDCTAIGTATLTSPEIPTITNVAPTDPTDCGSEDGQIVINATGTNLEYSIDNGLNFGSDNTFTGLSAGPYGIVVRESGAVGCTVTDMAILTAPEAPSITEVIGTDPTTCRGADGELIINGIGTNLEYSIDGGANYEASNIFSSLNAGLYDIVVREQGTFGCTDITTATLENPLGTTPIISGPTTYLEGSGGVTLDAGAGYASYLWSPGGETTQTITVLEGTYSVTITEANGCEGTSIGIIVTEEQDTTAPEAICQNVTVQLDATGTAYITAADIDNGSNDISGIADLSLDINSFDCSNIGANMVTLTVVDNNGNIGSCTTTVTVEDIITPVIACPTNIDKLSSSSQVLNIIPATAIDNCAEGTEITFARSDNAALGLSDPFPQGITKIQWTATDASGNTDNCIQTITITLPQSTANEITSFSVDGQLGPELIDSNAGTVNLTVTLGTDVSALAPSIDISELATISPGSGVPQNFSAPVTYTVTAEDGSERQWTVGVTVQEDTTDPEITCPVDIIVENDSGQCGAILSYAEPVGTDNLPGATTVLTEGLPNGSSFPIGVTTQTYVVTDAAGNKASCSFTVTVNDTENPLIDCPTNELVTVAPGITSSIVTFVTSVSDNCPGTTLMQTAGLPSGSSFPLGTTTNVFQITDAAGNTASCSFDVTVEEEVVNTVLSVTSFTLVRADTDEDLFPLIDGMAIDINDLPTLNLDVRGNATDDVQSVSFVLSGAKNRLGTESVYPYALFQDLPTGNYQGSNFIVGSYILTGTPYSANDGNGDQGTSLTIGFELVDGDPTCAQMEVTVQTATGPTSCGGSDGTITINVLGSEAPLDFDWSHDGTLESNTATGLSEGSYTLTVTDSNNCSKTLTVSLEDPQLPTVTMPAFANVTVDTPMFALGGGLPVGGSYSGPGVGANDTFNPAIGVGTYTITYSYIDPVTGCANSATRSITVTPVVIDSTLMVVNANTDTPIYALTEGLKIRKKDIGNTPLGIVYNPGINPNDVNFKLTGPLTKNNIEGIAPYSLFGDFGLDIVGKVFPIGLYTLVVNPGIGATITVHFEITDTDPLCDNFNLTVLSKTDTTTCNGSDGSVTLSVTGAVEPLDFDWSHDESLESATATGLSAGSYTVTVTDNNDCSKTLTINVMDPQLPSVTLSPFSNKLDTAPAFALGGGSPLGGNYSGIGVDTNGMFDPGAVGAGTYAITYTYTNATTGCVNSVVRNIRVISTSVLSVSGFVLVNADSNKDILTITNGMVIDVSSYPTLHLDIRANTTPDIESVSLVLSGTKTNTRTENFTPYALYGDSPSGNYLGSDFVVGTYTITATPYTGNELKGTKGAPSTLNFTLVQGVSNTAKLVNRMKMSPNPAIDRTTVSFGEPVKLTQFFVYDITGRLIKTIESETAKDVENIELSVYDLPIGTYFVRTTDSSGNGFQQRLVIEQ